MAKTLFYPSMDEGIQKDLKGLKNQKFEAECDARAAAEEEDRIRHERYDLEQKIITAQGGLDRIQNPSNREDYLDRWIEENMEETE